MFAYPKAKHVRQERPPRYSNYRKFKPHLQREFGRTCVYCRLPDTVSPSSEFGVEHYRPKKLFPQLECEYTNLLYCCPSCNRRKGAYWPTPTRLLLDFVPNPCDHVMWEHMKFVSAKVEARTPAGEFTVRLLDLNDDRTVAWRGTVIRLAERQRQRIAEVERRVARIMMQRDQLPRHDDSKVESILAQLQGALDLLRMDLAMLDGSAPI